MTLVELGIESILPQDDSQDLVFKGSRCQLCGEVVFAEMSDCPLCQRPDSMQPYALVAHGKLVDHVLAERGPAGFAVPYVQAYVRLDDGPVIYTMIDSDDPRSLDLRAGMPVVGSRAVIRVDGETTYMGWKFRVENDD